MPFVTIDQNPDSPIKQNAYLLERRCKEAWVAMKEHSNSGPFGADEVGGLVAFDSNGMTGKPGSCVLRFYYADWPGRGLAFRAALFTELKTRLPHGIDIIPTATRSWFKEPVWSIK